MEYVFTKTAFSTGLKLLLDRLGVVSLSFPLCLIRRQVAAALASRQVVLRVRLTRLLLLVKFGERLLEQLGEGLVLIGAVVYAEVEHVLDGEKHFRPIRVEAILVHEFAELLPEHALH